MARLRVLGLDDSPEDRAVILDSLKFALRGAASILEFSLVSVPERLPTETTFTPDVAIYDVHLADDEQVPEGIVFALAAAPAYPKRLVILKSSAPLSPENRALIDNARKKYSANLVVADDLLWPKHLQQHLLDWLRRGGAQQIHSPLYGPVECELTGDTSTYERAAQIVPIHWARGTRDNRELDALLATLKLLGRVLRSETRMTRTVGLPYLRVPFPKDGRLVPWEFLLFDEGSNLTIGTPIARVLDHPVPQGSRATLGSLLLVHGDGISWAGELDAAKSVLGWTGLSIDEMHWKRFLEEDAGAGPVDVLHLALHNQGFDGDQLALLDRAVARCNPRLIVFNACNSAEMLIATPLQYFREPLERAFDRRLEALVATQFLLEDKSASLWAHAFYTHLSIFRDVGIAAGAARELVASKTCRLFELATIAVARRGTEFCSVA